MVIKSLLQRKIIELPALNVLHIFGGVLVEESGRQNTILPFADVGESINTLLQI